MTVYEIVTEEIIKQLEGGTAPWHKPWHCEEHRNLVSKKAYRGINVFLLSTRPFPSPWWLTFRQAKELGGSVRKGQRGTMVVFWKRSAPQSSLQCRNLRPFSTIPSAPSTFPAPILCICPAWRGSTRPSTTIQRCSTK